MCVRFEIGDKERQRDQHHQRAGDVHRQVGQRDNRQHGGDPAHHTRQDRARRRELGDDPVGREQDQQSRDRRVDQGVQKEHPEGHREILDLRPGRVQGQGAGRPGYDTSIDDIEQTVQIRGLEVGYMDANGFLGADVDAVAHGVFGPVGVAPVDGGEVAHPGHGVVEHLLAEVTGEVGAGSLDRVGGADVGAGCHRQDVRRLRDEEPCRSRPRATRVDECDHGHVAVQEAGHDLVHGSRDAARRVDHHQKRVRVVVFGAGYGRRDVRRHDVVDVAVQVRLFDTRRGCGSRGGCQGGERQQAG